MELSSRVASPHTPEGIDRDGDGAPRTFRNRRHQMSAQCEPVQRKHADATCVADVQVSARDCYSARTAQLARFPAFASDTRHLDERARARIETLQAMTAPVEQVNAAVGTERDV
jgi:hypothetical protein